MAEDSRPQPHLIHLRQAGKQGDRPPVPKKGGPPPAVDTPMVVLLPMNPNVNAVMLKFRGFYWYLIFDNTKVEQGRNKAEIGRTKVEIRSK